MKDLLPNNDQKQQDSQMPSANSGELQDLLAGYVDGEIDEHAVAAVEQQINQSTELAAEVEAQRRVKGMLKEQAEHVIAPAHLKARIHRELHKRSGNRGFIEHLRELLLWQPVPTFATALLLIFLSSAVTYYGTSSSRLASPVSEQLLADGTIAGTVTCVDCEIQKRFHQNPNHNAQHRGGILTADGSLYSVLPNGNGHDLLQNARMGQQIKIAGDLLTMVRYVHVSDYSVH